MSAFRIPGASQLCPSNKLLVRVLLACRIGKGVKFLQPRGACSWACRSTRHGPGASASSNWTPQVENCAAIGTVVKLREQPARILLLLSRCTALTLFGNQTTPLRARFGHAPSHHTNVLPHPAPGKKRPDPVRDPVCLPASASSDPRRPSVLVGRVDSHIYSSRSVCLCHPFFGDPLLVR